MNFNRIISLLAALAILAGCGSGGYESADKAAAPSSQTSFDSGDSTQSPRANGSARLATQTKSSAETENPEMRKAANKRAVIRNGSLSVRVPNVEEAEHKVSNFVSEKGGFVSASESSDLASQSPTITLSLRVPVETFDAAMLMFEGLGTRLTKKVQGEDVTAKVVDFDARMQIMVIQEAKLRKALASANFSDSATLEDRLMRLREEIESLTAQRKALGELAALSTIDLTLQGEAKGMADLPDKGWVQQAWNTATSVLGAAFRVITSIAIFALVLSPIWVPIAFVIRRSTKKLIEQR